MLKQSIYQSLLLTLVLVLPSKADDAIAMFTMKLEEFKRLSVGEQREVVKAAFKHRIDTAENVEFQAMQSGGVYEYSVGKIGALRTDLNGARYHYRRLGASYLVRWELGGVDVAKPDEWGESGYDSASGAVTSTFRGDIFPKQVHARIDSSHNSFTSTLRYLYWLDGRSTPRDPANYVINDVVRQIDSSTIECVSSSGMVRLTIPWIPPWEQVPRGTRIYVLDPTKGFLPVEGRAVLSYEPSSGHLIWRTEDFSIETSKLVGDVWVPTRLKETIRASSGGESLENGEASVLQTEILEFSFKTVKPDDLRVTVPEGAFVNNAIEGVAYSQGAMNDRIKETRYVGNPHILPTGNTKKTDGTSRIPWIILLNVPFLLVLAAIFRYRRSKPAA